MIFDPKSGALYEDNGALIKYLHCPLGLKISELRELPDNSPDRHCTYCQKKILCADNMTDTDLLSAVANSRSNPDRNELDASESTSNKKSLNESSNPCIFVTPQAKNIVILRNEKMNGWGHVEPNRDNLLEIQTARSLEVMKEASKMGFRPLIYATGSIYNTGRKLKIFQHIKTGEVWAGGDFRNASPTSDEIQKRLENLDENAVTPEEFQIWITSIKNDWIEVTPWFNYQPNESFPYAAYLVPQDLSIGQRVYINDVIKEVPIEISNQGDTERLKSCSAVWTGEAFKLEVPEVDFGWIG